MMPDAAPPPARPGQPNAYVGALVGESTSREFRLALKHDSVREQDLIAVDAVLKKADGSDEEIRVWAKVKVIERINPLFPREAGHELAATQTGPIDTVLSFSQEMVTAVCGVLGCEPRGGAKKGKLDQLRYPAQPASSAYRPDSKDVARIVLGELAQQQDRGLDLATLSNRPEVDVKVDGHAVVTRHLAILAMTGAGKSWTARRLIEELAEKDYPIVIFDPHGDYTKLGEVQALKNRVRRFYATFPVFEEDADTVASIVDTLGYKLTDTMRDSFGDLFSTGRAYPFGDDDEMMARTNWVRGIIGRFPGAADGPYSPNLFFLADLAEAAEATLRLPDDDPERSDRLQQLEDWGWPRLRATANRRTANTLEGIKKRCRSAGKALARMERANRQTAANGAEPLPQDRGDLISYGQISVVSLSGYTNDFQATLYALIAEEIFEKRVRGELDYRVLFVLEEAHKFAPAKASTDAERRAVQATRQTAQEGRKFGVGQVLISQRPSRLDETTLSQCNSFVVMRLVNPADQRFVRTVIETLGEDDVKLLPDLDVGEALISGQFINFPVLVKIKKPESRGEREEGEKTAFEQLREEHAAAGKKPRRKDFKRPRGSARPAAEPARA